MAQRSTTPSTSVARDGTAELHFGTGGVDDAEDGEIVWHEIVGHAMLTAAARASSVPSEGGAIHEGWGDYVAATISTTVRRGQTKFHADDRRVGRTSYSPGESRLSAGGWTG